MISVKVEPLIKAVIGELRNCIRGCGAVFLHEFPVQLCQLLVGGMTRQCAAQCPDEGRALLGEGMPGEASTAGVEAHNVPQWFIHSATQFSRLPSAALVLVVAATQVPDEQLGFVLQVRALRVLKQVQHPLDVDGLHVAGEEVSARFSMAGNNKDSTPGSLQQLHIPNLGQLVPRLVGCEGEVGVTAVTHLLEHVSQIVGVGLRAFQAEVLTILEGTVAKDANVASGNCFHIIHVRTADLRLGLANRQLESSLLLRARIKLITRMFLLVHASH